MEYLFTERAHLMCPNMYFGIALSVNHPCDKARIRKTVEDLSSAHPFLNALLGYEKERNAYYYEITDRPKVAYSLKEQEINSIDAPEVMAEFGRMTAYDWNLFEEGMLKIAVWRMKARTGVLLVFHHLLADGRGALRLAEEFADDYAFGILPKYVPEKLIASEEDFPKDSRLPLVSRLLVGKANRDWEKENRQLSYPEYHKFADEFLQNDSVQYSKIVLDSGELEQIRTKCHAYKITVNDYLMAKMFLENDTNRIIMAHDLRPRLGIYQEGALGNYSTAFSISVRKKKELFDLAQTVHQLVQKKMNRLPELFLVLQCYAALDPGLLDAALISCRGDFGSKAGRFIGSMFFGFKLAQGCSITNLGRIESSSIEAGFFIPPASPAVRKIQGVLTVNSRMTVITRERAETD